MGRAFAPNIVTSDKAAGGATIERSISLNDGSVVRFHRTGSVGVDGNRRVHTVSMWMKRTVMGSERHFFSTRYGSGTPYNDFRFEASDKLNCYYYSGTWNSTSWRYYNSHQKYRDSNGWYHFVLAFNSTLSTASERVKIYMNGERVTTFDTADHPSQNHENSICGNGYTHTIAGLGNVSSQNWDGNIAECILVDGAELEPTDFAFTDDLTGHWKPKKFDPVKSNIPNKKGVVYSSTWTASGNGFGNAPVTRAYDAPTGNLNSDYANNSAGGQILTWDTSSFNLKGSLRIYGYSSSGVYDVYVNGQKAADTPSSHGWIECGTHTKINEIQFAGTSYNTNNGLGAAGIYFNAFIVDGVWLRDDTHPFGQEGHHINFSDTSGLTATTIGRDYSGSGNNFTPVNLQSDMINVKDSCSGFAYPTTSPVPANYPYWNRVQNGIDATTELGSRRISGANYRMARSSFIFGPSNGITSGKYYWEVNNSGGGTYGMYTGITASFTQAGGEVASETNKNWLGSHYYKLFNQSSGVSRTNEGAGACSFQIDLDKRIMRGYYKGNLVFTDTSIPDATTTDFAPFVHSTNGSWMDATINFGQVAFNYPALASGYRILASNAVPSTSIRPQRHFETLLYTGNGSSPRTVGGLEFKPDFVWLKDRTGTNWHRVQDSIRGAHNTLYSNSTNAEAPNESNGHVNDFTNDGFIVDDASGGAVNTNNSNYVAWCWKGGSPRPATSGSVTFDGANGTNLRIANSADIQIGSTSNWTIEFWLKRTAAYSDYDVIVGKGASGTYEWFVEGFANGDVKFLYTTDGNTTWAGTHTIISSSVLDRWYHIAIVRNGSGANNFKTYVDGSQTFQTTAFDIYAGTYGLDIGGYGGATAQDPPVVISNLRIVKGTSVYTSNFTPPTSPLTNITNTKLLCCQSIASATTATVTPNSITVNGSCTPSSLNPFDAFSVDGVAYGTASAAGITEGTIPVTGVSVNKEAGFSIVTFTGTGSAGTVGHGLGKAPDVVITKRRNAAQAWFTHHKGLSNGHYIRLNANSAQGGDTNVYPNNMSTTNTFAVGGDDGVNGNGSTYVSYCWHSVPGYSKFGSFEGNGSSNGPFVFTGFRPAMFFYKRIDGSDDWGIHDNKRDVDNPIQRFLYPDDNYAEWTGGTNDHVDFLSNGFKIRNPGSMFNQNNETIVYWAFAETPQTSPNGGQSRAR